MPPNRALLKIELLLEILLSMLLSPHVNQKLQAYLFNPFHTMATPQLPKNRARRWRRKRQGYTMKSAHGAGRPASAKPHIEKGKTKEQPPGRPLGWQSSCNTLLSRKTRTWADQAGGQGSCFLGVGVGVHLFSFSPSYQNESCHSGGHSQFQRRTASQRI